MGACMGQYAVASLAVWNHLQHQPGQVSILLLFIVKLVINAVMSLPDTRPFDNYMYTKKK